MYYVQHTTHYQKVWVGFTPFYFSIVLFYFCSSMYHVLMIEMYQKRIPLQGTISRLKAVEPQIKSWPSFPVQIPSLALKGLMVVRDFCFWAVWASTEKSSGLIMSNFWGRCFFHVFRGKFFLHFFEYCRVRTKKMHKMKFKKMNEKNLKNLTMNFE